MFPSQSASMVLNCLHATSGIDAFVTKQRTILLDTQPLESASVLASLERSADGSAAVKKKKHYII